MKSALFLLMVTALATAAADDAPLVVTATHCSAQWRHAMHDAPQPLRNTPKSFVAGEAVRCTSAGSLDLLVYGRKISFKHANVWYPVPDSAPGNQTPEERRVAEAFAKITQRGGRKRALGDISYAVTPENMILFWRPRPDPLLIEVEIPGEQPWKTLATEEAGRFQPEELSRLLKRYQERGGGTFRVRYTDQGGSQTEQTLLLISEQRQHDLDSQLANWDNESELIKHVGRAASLQEAQMPEYVGQEYEQAITAAPDSVELVLSAISAYRRAGDHGRAQALARRLPAGTSENPE